MTGSLVSRPCLALIVESVVSSNGEQFGIYAIVKFLSFVRARRIRSRQKGIRGVRYVPKRFFYSRSPKNVCNVRSYSAAAHSRQTCRQSALVLRATCAQTRYTKQPCARETHHLTVSSCDVKFISTFLIRIKSQISTWHLCLIRKRLLPTPKGFNPHSYASRRVKGKPLR